MNDKKHLFQTNAGSLLGLYGEKVRQTAWIMIENGWSHFFGFRRPCPGDYQVMFDAHQLICERNDKHTADLLCHDFPGMIANGKMCPIPMCMYIAPANTTEEVFSGDCLAKILITGITGFVGAAVLRKISREDHEIHALIRPGTPANRFQEFASRITIHNLDLADTKALRRFLSEQDFTDILHIGALRGGRKATETNTIAVM